MKLNVHSWLSHNLSSCNNWLIWHFYKDFFFFKCGPFLMSLLNLLQYCFCLCFGSFVHKAREILAPWLGIETSPLALGCEVPILTFLKLNMSFSFFKVIHDTHWRNTQSVVREEWSEVEWKKCRAGHLPGSVLRLPSIPWVTEEAGTHFSGPPPSLRLCTGRKLSVSWVY